jgi:hypothetical protein
MKKKTFFTGILSLALVFGMLLFVGCPTEDDGGNNTGGDNTGGDNTGGNTTGKNIMLYMAKPAGWSNLYAYVWDDSGKEFTATTPGTALTTASSGFYSYQAQSAEYGYVNVRFSDGSSNKTLDILGVDTDTYYQSAGAYAGDSSKVLLRASNTATIATPQFKAKEKTDSTITLTWDPVPGIDGYILYDEFVEFDDDDEEIPGSEYWHFQKAFFPSERSIYDDNYGQYLDPETIYTWKLVAIKYKDNADLNVLDSIDPDDLSEDDYVSYYNVVYDFGELEVKTLESSLPAPTGLKVASTTPTSVELTWNETPDADYYMVWWYDDEADEWLYIEEAYDNHYIDADEEFIFPESSYQYFVVAHNERTYSNDSTEVTATTPLAYSASVNRSLNDISRAVSAPSSVFAYAATNAANTIKATWPSVSGATSYNVGLFTSSSSSTPLSGTTKKASGTFSSLPYTYTNVSASKGSYYFGVQAVTGSQKSTWKIYSSPVAPFVPVSIKSPKSVVSGSNKVITATMNATWKTGVSYKYEVSYSGVDSKGAKISNTVSFTSSAIKITAPKGPIYTVTITPYANNVKWANPLTFTK